MAQLRRFSAEKKLPAGTINSTLIDKDTKTLLRGSRSVPLGTGSGAAASMVVTSILSKRKR